MTIFFTLPQPVRPKEAPDSVSTIRDVVPVTVELAVRFSLRTQCKRCSTVAFNYMCVERTRDLNTSIFHFREQLQCKELK